MGGGGMRRLKDVPRTHLDPSRAAGRKLLMSFSAERAFTAKAAVLA
jgi:hypothetical protein